ncbi:hypothetical protein KM176_01515 [Pseudooceanicola sp. CBS1P-1]|uniref:Uncharacterized protein n=1 Tax=Pseudooceanicola albus TaxID=2692189 RepID=A0A6L7FZ81_9RHOB|nr:MULTISPECIES: hypothetical protein [Pseudooceanicola]MBT9382524.1 hypothetical protein [Pseudooceanicola endophyticus]MXN17065.1 hypothetical protein [Pseudooceanicola albus]
MTATTGLYDNETAQELLSGVAEVGVPVIREILAVCDDAWADDDFTDSELEDGLAILVIVAGALDPAAPEAQATRAALPAPIQSEIRALPRGPLVRLAQMVAVKAPDLLEELGQDPQEIAGYMATLQDLARVIAAEGEAA